MFEIIINHINTFSETKDKYDACRSLALIVSLCSCRVPDINFTYRWGRLECPTSPDDFTSVEDDFPSPFFGRQEMIEYFMDPNGFGLTEDEVFL